MGEYAEMMLDGTVCEGCGEVFDDVIDGTQPPGHPRRCGRLSCEPAISLTRALRTSLVPKPSAAARRSARHNRERHEIAKQRKPFSCPHCTKLFRTENGMHEHRKVVHSSALPLHHLGTEP